MGMVKEGIVDYKRHKSDNETNKLNASVYDYEKKEMKTMMWRDIKVGDIISLKDKEKVPADIIILATSDSSGVGYCSTATLDGERTLKSKQAIPYIQDLFKIYKNKFLDKMALEITS